MRFSFDGLKKLLVKKGPEILLTTGVIGMISTVVMAVKATPKALTLMDEASNEKNDELTSTEVVKVCWKVYIPTIITGTASIGCVIFSAISTGKRIDALTAACELSEAALTRYRNAVVETIGDKKELDVRDKMCTKYIEDNPPKENSIYITNSGDTLMYDTLSGRYFKSDIEKIRKAQNDLNNSMLYDTYASVNDFYDLIGLSFTSLGDNLVWKVEDGMLEIHFSAQLTPDNKPCVVINYNINPKYLH